MSFKYGVTYPYKEKKSDQSKKLSDLLKEFNDVIEYTSFVFSFFFRK